MKRLFGYDKTDDNSSIRLYTLDILAKYVGFENWALTLSMYNYYQAKTPAISTADKSTLRT